MYEYGTAAQMPLAFLEILDLRARRSRWYRIEYSLAGVARSCLAEFNSFDSNAFFLFGELFFLVRTLCPQMPDMPISDLC